MNLLSKSEVFAENKLFCHPRHHRTQGGGRQPAVPPCRYRRIHPQLPADLVDSFKSTLDETREADLLLHVVDISHPDFEEQIQVVENTLKGTGLRR